MSKVRRITKIVRCSDRTRAKAAFVGGYRLVAAARIGCTALSIGLGLLALICPAQAQTALPVTPATDQSAAQSPTDADATQSMETPLPNKVLGQVPFTAQYAIGGETTFILQHLFAFPSPYSGPNSLRSRNETELSHSYSLSLGVRPIPRFEVYLNPELAIRCADRIRGLHCLPTHTRPPVRESLSSLPPIRRQRRLRPELSELAPSAGRSSRAQ